MTSILAPLVGAAHALMGWTATDKATPPERTLRLVHRPLFSQGSVPLIVDAKGFMVDLVASPR